MAATTTNPYWAEFRIRVSDRSMNWDDSPVILYSVPAGREGRTSSSFSLIRRVTSIVLVPWRFFTASETVGFRSRREKVDASLIPSRMPATSPSRTMPAALPATTTERRSSTPRSFPSTRTWKLLPAMSTRPPGSSALLPAMASIRSRRVNR